MFRFFDKPIVKISLICVFSALICISIGLQIYDADVPGQVAAQKKERQEEKQKEKEASTYQIIGDLSYGRSACTVNKYGYYTIKYNKVTNSALNNKPKQVSAQDWNNLLRSIKYRDSGMQDDSYENSRKFHDGDTVNVVVERNEDVEDAFCQKYSCTLKVKKPMKGENQYYYKVPIKGYNAQIITPESLETSRKDILQAVEQHTKDLINEDYNDDGDTTFTGKNFVLYCVNNNDPTDVYLVCGYSVRYPIVGEEEDAMLCYAYGPIFGDNLKPKDITSHNQYDSSLRVQIDGASRYDMGPDVMNQIEQDCKKEDGMALNLTATKVQQLQW